MPGYRFEHPRDEGREVYVDTWSYLWAGLFGCLYVAAKGGRHQLLKALAIDVGYLALFAVAVVVSFLFAPLVQIGLVVLALPVVLVLHGIAIVRLLRDSYLRRGWFVERA